MIQQIDAYLSGDGKIFLDRDSAEKHELEQMQEVFYNLLESCEKKSLIKHFWRLDIVETCFPNKESLLDFCKEVLTIANKENHLSKETASKISIAVRD